MKPDLDVDTDELSRAAGGIRATASRVREATGPAPQPVPGPRWATADAAAAATDAQQLRLRTVSADLTEVAEQVDKTIAAYEAADARAATRLRAGR